MGKIWDFLRRELSSSPTNTNITKIKASDRPPADSSTIPDEEKQYYKPDEYYSYDSYGGAAKALFGTPSVIPFDERKKTAIPSSRGLYPPEILLISYCHKYPKPKGGYPSFWWFRYGIRDIGMALKSLEERGFIGVASTEEMLPQYTIPELKNILASHNLAVGGNKGKLVERIIENISKSELEKIVNVRRYKPTEKGLAELKDNDQVTYIHRHPDMEDLDAWNIDKKFSNIKLPFKASWHDKMWAYLNRASMQHVSHGDMGLYRNCKLTMAKFLMDEDKNKQALSLLHEVAELDRRSGDFRDFQSGVPPGIIALIKHCEDQPYQKNKKKEKI
jgi:hypothetical protein